MQKLINAAIEGAATYSAIGNTVWMTDTDGIYWEIQICKDYDRATKAAERWQIKENKAVLKSQKALSRIHKP